MVAVTVLLLLLLAVHSAIHGDTACSTTSVQIVNCGARVYDTNTQAIETSDNQLARNFLIHEIELYGSPLSLRGLYLKAQREPQVNAFVEVYEAAYATVSDDAFRLRRDEQLLCASIAFVRMFDVACQHIFCISGEEKNQFETSAAVSELFNHLHTHFPHVDDAKRKNQLRNFVLHEHPARAGCSDSCRNGFCSSGAGGRCKKSQRTLALVERLNHCDTSFQVALVDAKTYIGEGPSTASSRVVSRHSSHVVGEDEFMARSSDRCTGCVGLLSRWLHTFRSLHLKTRRDYTNADRAQFIASAVQICPRMLQICEIVMRRGGLRIQLGPNPQDYRVFGSVEDLPEVSACAVIRPPQFFQHYH